MNKILLIFALLFFFQHINVVSGQSLDDYPVYIVQAGDTLTSIAQKFGISPQDIINSNNISNPDILPVGTRLIIPSLAGVSGTLITTTVAFGHNISSLSLGFSIPIDLIARINRLTSPVEIYAGAPLILPEQVAENQLVRITFLGSGQSLLDLSVLFDQNPWVLKSQNNLPGDWAILTNDIIYSDQKAEITVSVFSPLIQDISITPLPLTQGETMIIRVITNGDIRLSGSLQENNLNFIKNGPDEYIAIQGIFRDAETGLSLIKISGQTPTGENISLEQSILIEQGYFRVSAPLTVPPETIDPVNTKPEDDLIRSIVTPVTPTRYWNGKFFPANKEPDCITAWFGDERIYNGTLKSFHGGVDFGVCVTPSLDIYAPAAGKVVFSGELTIRGNATIIDHGWGVYSGIWHQKATYVQVGDFVEQGQLIGLIGDTGRVSGPHLHWEIWVGGQQVNPLTWLQNTYP